MEILGPDDDSKPLLVISQDKVPTSAYQAIYHKLTSKVDKLQEAFDDAYEVRITDLSHLNDLVVGAVGQFQLKGKATEIVVSLKKGEIITFPDFVKFSSFNFSTLCSTASVNYTFDFFTVLPVEIEAAQDIVQRFKISVNIDQDFVEERDDGLPAYLMGVWVGRNIKLTIEYADYAVARNIQSAVRDWVQSLPTKKLSSVVKLLNERGEGAQFLVPRVMPAGAILWYSLYVAHVGVPNLQEGVIHLFKGFALAILAQVIGYFLVVNFYRELALVRPLSFILLTEGDRRRCTKIGSMRLRRSSILYILGTVIVLGFAVSIAASYAYAHW